MDTNNKASDPLLLGSFAAEDLQACLMTEDDQRLMEVFQETTIKMEDIMSVFHNDATNDICIKPDCSSTTTTTSLSISPSLSEVSTMLPAADGQRRFEDEAEEGEEDLLLNYHYRSFESSSIYGGSSPSSASSTSSGSSSSSLSSASSPSRNAWSSVSTVDSSHCSVCKLVFSSATELAEHRASFSKSLNCCQCGKRFPNSTKLASHHRKHSKEKPFQCRSCGKYYTHRTTLARHQLHYCQTLRAKCEDNRSGGIELFPTKTEEDDVLAAADALSLSVSTNLIMHNDGGSNSNNNNNNILNDVAPPPQPETKCRICAKEFYDAQSLANHTNFFTSSRTCCQCSRVLGNKSKLITHHRSHTKESPYACAFCEKRFSENSTLRKHEATHGARNFSCPHCDKGFVRKDYLAKHLLTHRQTYKCSQCAFVCHSGVEIETHVLLHA